MKTILFLFNTDIVLYCVVWNKFECKTILSIVRTCIFYLSIFRYKPLTRLRNACKYCIVLQWKKWYGGKTHYCVKYHCYSISFFLFLKFHCIDIMLSHPKNNCPFRSWLLVTYCDMPQNKMVAWKVVIRIEWYHFTLSPHTIYIEVQTQKSMTVCHEKSGGNALNTSILFIIEALHY